MQKNRNTRQRQLLLSEIKKLKTHPSARELFEILRKKDANYSIATLYRNLEYFTNKQLVYKLKSNGTETRYESDLSPHINLVCEHCGFIEDIYDFESIDFLTPQIQSSGFDLKIKFLEIPGTCKKCQNKNIY